MVKKSTVQDIIVSKPYYQAVKINENDKLINVEIVKKEYPILMLSAQGYSLAFSSDEVPLQGRISAGVKGINLEEKDYVVFASQIDYDSVVVVSDNGFIKKIKTSLFPLASRYRKGLKYINFAGNGKIVAFACSDEGDSTLAVDFGLKILPLETKKLPYSDRLSNGNEIIKKKFFSINKYQLLK